MNARVAAGPGRRLGIAAAGGGDSGSQTEAAPARRAQAALRPCSGSTLGTVDEALGRAWPRLLKEPGLLPGVNRRTPTTTTHPTCAAVSCARCRKRHRAARAAGSDPQRIGGLAARWLGTGSVHVTETALWWKQRRRA